MLTIRLDPWDVEYGPEVAAEEEGPSDIVLDPEFPPEAWRPIEPASSLSVSRLVFVDGVRRVDSRLVVSSPEVPHAYGAFGSFAAGSVEVSESGAQFGRLEVRRVLVLGSGLRWPGAFGIRPDVVYEPLSTEHRDPEAPLRKLQEEMRLLEEDLARKLADDDRTLVVLDGPLTFAGPSRGAAVGYIKRIQRFYVPDALLSRLRELPPGTRTPVFVMHSPRRFARYSWFVRLAPPHPADSPFAGLVRLEVSESVGLAAAQRLADGTARALVRFVRPPGTDPRFPQNLAPIGALERRLRRALGEALLLRREIRARIVREVGHA